MLMFNAVPYPICFGIVDKLIFFLCSPIAKTLSAWDYLINRFGFFKFNFSTHSLVTNNTMK